MKIAVLTSGGVDSSVALRLLHEQGYELTAFYLKIWLEDELQHLGDCPWAEDLSFVQKICSRIGVPLRIIPMQKEYWDRIVQYTIQESKAGCTPNPDVLCNQFIKFGAFYDQIDDSFEKVATGHYAQAEEKEGQFFLRKAPDPIKDQTYFLSRLNQKQLSRALFPIGHLMKSEVRALAEKYDLPNQHRKDSQGICFLGKFKYRDFLHHHLGEQKGDFVERETGKKIGEHLGYFHYTIGQRQGLNLSGGPWFVVDKDIPKNIVYISNGYEPEEVYKSEFDVEELRWIASSSEDPSTPLGMTKRYGDANLFVKIRHGESIHECTLKIEGDRGHVTLKEPVHGVAAGQFAVFYNQEYCLGAGVIL
ncbi:tRNA 2-thiouridine(34) synthase MnmA [Candidatus Peregrinibacteria bacterium CG_4_10_14_0_2_um_filter_43_11]|nr:MAG: tRNA 2-thiouridine(34) synthase MnmA [Candidatus Peregrinibacteria bacterium CG_4_10_14_0_2_um_filter_43_11]